MCDFFVSEVWWMETIIASLISASVTLLGSFIFYNYSIRKIGDTTGRIENSVADKHKDLSTEHKGLSTEHDCILEAQNTLQHIGSSLREEQREERRKLERLHEFMLEKDAAQEHRYHLLSSDHQRMVGEVQQGVNAFTVLIEEVGRLNQKCKQLEIQTQQVTQERDIMEKQVEQQQTAYNQLVQQYNQLVESFRRNERRSDRGIDR